MGEKDPSLTYSVTGIVGNDKKEDVIIGSLVRKTGETAGTYDIEQGTLAIANEYSQRYTIKFTGANLKINEKPSTPAPTAGTPTAAPAATAPSTGTPMQEPAAKEQQNIDTLALNAGFKVSQIGSKIRIQWGKVQSADSYDVYVEYCGGRFSKTPVKITSGNSVTVAKLNGKKINLKRNFKVYVTAKSNNKKLAHTMVGHIVGRKNKKYTNAKSIKLKTGNLSIAAGKKVQIKAKTVLVNSRKKQLSDTHAKEFRYATSDKSIANVSNKGVVTGIKAGKCNIYVYARNGYAKKVIVTVR